MEKRRENLCEEENRRESEEEAMKLYQKLWKE